MTISPPSTTNHSTKKAVYLQAFDKYFNSLPSEDPSTSPLNPASPPSLNSKLNYNALPKNTNFIAEEKEHLRFLSERFGDKLPYLRDRLAEFIEKHPDPNDTATVIMPSNKEDQATGRMCTSSSSPRRRKPHILILTRPEISQTKSRASPPTQPPQLTQCTRFPPVRPKEKTRDT